MLQKRVNPIFPTLNDSSSAKFKKKKRISLESGGNQITLASKAIEKSVVEFRFVGLVFAQSRSEWRIASSLAVCGEDCLQKDARKAVWLCNKDMRRVRKNVHTTAPIRTEISLLRINLRIVSSIQGMGASQAGFRLSASGLIKLLARRWCRRAESRSCHLVVKLRGTRFCSSSSPSAFSFSFSFSCFDGLIIVATVSCRVAHLQISAGLIESRESLVKILRRVVAFWLISVKPGSGWSLYQPKYPLIGFLFREEIDRNEIIARETVLRFEVLMRERIMGWLDGNEWIKFSDGLGFIVATFSVFESVG